MAVVSLECKVYSGCHPMWKWTWQVGGHEGHKKGEKPGHCASRGKEMQKTREWQIHSRSCTPAAGCASREKMVYWHCSSNIFGSQLFDHWSDILLECSIYRYKFVYSNICTPITYWGADKSLAWPTSRCILFDGENILFDASLVIYMNSTNIPPIMIIGYLNIKIFYRCSLFPSWLG